MSIQNGKMNELFKFFSSIIKLLLLQLKNNITLLTSLRIVFSNSIIYHCN